MKSLYFLVLVGLYEVHGAVKSRVSREAHIPAPELTKLTAIDPTGFEVQWKVVDSYDINDPIIGYKVMVWEFSDIKTYKYEIINGVPVLVEDSKKAEIKDTDKLPKKEPRIIDVPGGDKTVALIDNIKLNVPYEVRILAYTKKEEGLLSVPMRIELKDAKSAHDKDLYKVDP